MKQPIGCRYAVYNWRTQTFVSWHHTSPAANAALASRTLRYGYDAYEDTVMVDQRQPLRCPPRRDDDPVPTADDYSV